MSTSKPLNMQSSSASVHGSVHPQDAVMESAVARVAELLKRSDDLDKVELITQRLQREKAAIDVQLKAEVKSQIDSTGGAVIKLADSKRIMAEIKGELKKIDRLCSESQLAVRDFEKINRLANIHRNFIKTQEFADNMKSLHGRIQQVNDMIEDDCGDGQGGIEAQLDSHVPNLLTIHYMLSEMRDFRDSAMFHAERASEDTRRTTIKHFAPLDPLIAKFDRVVEDVGGNLLEFIRSGNTSLVVRLAKIIDLEEREDLKATVLLEVNGKAKTNGHVNGNTSKNSMNITLGNNVAPRAPRGYPTLFLRAMEKSIKDSFEACIESFPGDCQTLLENLAWIYTDLELTRMELAALVPKRWQIFDTVLKFYHVETHNLLDQVLATDPDAQSILAILNYVKDYYDTMKKGFSVSKEQLQPPLLDGKENDLYDDYMKLIVNKLNEWMENLATTERQAFINRDNAPEMDNDGRYALQGEVITFKMITQQIEVAADSQQGRILAGVVEECGNVLKDRQASWEAIMTKEVKKEIRVAELLRDKKKRKEAEKAQANGQDIDSDDELQNNAGLVDYMIALANDQIRGADYTEALSSKVAPVVSQKYSTQISSTLETVSDGYVAFAKLCTNSLIEIIFSDLKPAFDILFETSTIGASAWYKGIPMSQITDTLAEYYGDVQSHMNPLLIEVFLDDLLDETVLHYLQSLKSGKHHKVSLKLPKASVQIKQDIGKMYDFFDEHHSSREHVQQVFKVFEHLLWILESPIEELGDKYTQLKAEFWDCPLSFFEAVVNARKDIDSKVAKELISVVRSEALLGGGLEEEQQATIMGRYGRG